MASRFPEAPYQGQNSRVAQTPDGRAPLSHCPGQVPHYLRQLKPRVGASVPHGQTPPHRPQETATPALHAPALASCAQAHSTPAILPFCSASPDTGLVSRPAGPLQVGRWPSHTSKTDSSRGPQLSYPATCPTLCVAWACRQTLWARAHSSQPPRGLEGLPPGPSSTPAPGGVSWAFHKGLQGGDHKTTVTYCRSEVQEQARAGLAPSEGPGGDPALSASIITRMSLCLFLSR